MRLISLLLLTTTLMACNAGAGEADIRKNLESRFPGAKVGSISKTPVNGIFEVVVDGNTVIYSDKMGNYVFLGELMDTQNRRNLTREKVEKLMEVKFDSLPLQQAIKIVRGNGKRVMAVFSDPDCPYCRKLEQELIKLDNVTIHVFPYPLPMHGDAPRKSRMVWCSDDRAQAWLDLMLRDKLPNAKDTCENPIDANLALGQKLRIEGTPAIIFTNGKRLPGYVDAGKLEQLLAEVDKAPAGKK